MYPPGWWQRRPYWATGVGPERPLPAEVSLEGPSLILDAGQVELYDFTMPSFDGTIHAIEPDGQGGYFFGGEFGTVTDAVAAHSRPRVAHIDKHGNVTGWTSQLSASFPAVYALRYVQEWNNVVMGGDGGSEGFVLVDLGLPDLPDPTFDQAMALFTNGPIYTMAVDSAAESVFFGGDFKEVLVPSDFRDSLGEWDLGTDTLTGFDPTPDDVVRSILFDGASGTLYVAGDFWTIGAASRPYLAAVSTVTGLATSWDPAADGGVLRIEWAPLPEHILAVGFFGSIGGETRPRLGEVSTSTGLATSFNADPALLPTPRTVAATADRVWVGGVDDMVVSTTRAGVAEFAYPSGTLTPVSVDFTSIFAVNAIAPAQVPGRVLAGGQFSGASGPRVESAGDNAVTFISNALRTREATYLQFDGINDYAYAPDAARADAGPLSLVLKANNVQGYVSTSRLASVLTPDDVPSNGDLGNMFVDVTGSTPNRIGAFQRSLAGATSFASGYTYASAGPMVVGVHADSRASEPGGVRAFWGRGGSELARSSAGTRVAGERTPSGLCVGTSVTLAGNPVASGYCPVQFIAVVLLNRLPTPAEVALYSDPSTQDARDVWDEADIRYYARASDVDGTIINPIIGTQPLNLFGGLSEADLVVL